MGIIVVILVIWLVVAVLGFVVKSLLWLGIVGVVLFLGTAAYAAVKGRK